MEAVWKALSVGAHPTSELRWVSRRLRDQVPDFHEAGKEFAMTNDSARSSALKLSLHHFSRPPRNLHSGRIVHGGFAKP